MMLVDRIKTCIMIARVLTIFGISALLAATPATSIKVSSLPSNFRRCSLSDSYFNRCLKEAIQSAIPEMVKGVPSLGVYSVDPLDIVEANIGNTVGPVNLNLRFRNLKLHGLATSRIHTFRYDTKKQYMRLTASVAVPFGLEGNYKVAGNVLVLPIHGEGRCNLTLEHVNSTMEIFAKEVYRGGIRFLSIEQVRLDFDTTRLHLYFENLFHGNKALGDNMNRFLNENWVEILRELKPSIRDTFGLTFQAIISRVFERVPYDKIFLK